MEVFRQLNNFTNTQLKEWCKFYRRLRSLGINGLKQESFVNKLKEMLIPRYFEFGYKQKPEKVLIADKIIIADVRQNPYVKPDFRPNDLEKLAAENNWEYRKYKHLGEPFYKKHLEQKDIKSAAREIVNYLNTDKNAIKDFNQLYSQFNLPNIVCIICYCNKGFCHRFLITEKLKRKKKLELRFSTSDLSYLEKQYLEVGN